MKLKTSFAFGFGLLALQTSAQEMHHEHSSAFENASEMAMSSSVDLLAPMSQEASGTAWLPASTPMYGFMKMFGRDMLMLHGDVHPRFVYVGSDRGDSRVDAPNWFMGMYSHPLNEREQLGFRAMVSLDPLTEGGFGYPLLFQSGETWDGDPLHDRQHPHDLISELSVTYSRLLNRQTSASLYLAYPGEPALGPPTFMHRLIAYDLPDAPIGHHWQDATHITWGVATAGLNFNNRLRAEGSVFTGREPDENRYRPDAARFDSYSGRLSFNPNSDHSFQISYGYVKNPEGDGVGVHRTTASWVYNKPLGADANFTATLVWGQNLLPGEGRTNSYLLEADYQNGKHTFFGRFENIDKSGHELALPEELHSNKYNLNAFTLGYVHDLTHGTGIDTGVGAALTLGTKPHSLDEFYGSGTPVSFQVFLRLRPSREKAHPMAEADEMEASHLGVSASITPDPPKARAQSAFTLTLTDAEGKPVTGATIKADLGMTNMDMGTSHPAFHELGEGRYQANLEFSMAGPWRVRLRITPPGSKETVTKSFDYEVGR